MTDQKGSLAMQISLSQDKREITIKFPSADVMMDANQAGQLINALALMRSNMLPEHAFDYAPQQRTIALPDPRWYTEVSFLPEGSLIHIRHPGFGWLSFLLPPNEAAKFASLLQAQAGEQEKPQSGQAN